MEKGKGSAVTPSQPNKLAPTKKAIAPSAPSCTTPPHLLVALANRPPPLGPREAAEMRSITHTIAGLDVSSQRYEWTSNRRSTQLATVEKCNIRKGVMDSVRDKP
jgi:hypothetical protein